MMEATGPSAAVGPRPTSRSRHCSCSGVARMKHSTAPLRPPVERVELAPSRLASGVVHPHPPDRPASGMPRGRDEFDPTGSDCRHRSGGTRGPPRPRRAPGPINSPERLRPAPSDLDQSSPPPARSSSGGVSRRREQMAEFGRIEAWHDGSSVGFPSRAMKGRPRREAPGLCPAPPPESVRFGTPAPRQGYWRSTPPAPGGHGLSAPPVSSPPSRPSAHAGPRARRRDPQAARLRTLLEDRRDQRAPR